MQDSKSMAVRALSGDGDTISRKMAIDAVKSYWKNEVDRIPKKSIDFDVFTQICDSILTHNANICKAIDKLPSEQPKQYWIDSEGKISALPSAQLATDTNVGDTISRKGVFIPDITVEMFRNASLEGVEDLMASGEMEDISLPSAQPERKKGKWIKLDMHAHIADHKCTACGQECYVPTCMGEPMYTYCPNCGADMRGESDE